MRRWPMWLVAPMGAAAALLVVALILIVSDAPHASAWLWTLLGLDALLMGAFAAAWMLKGVRAAQARREIAAPRPVERDMEGTGWVEEDAVPKVRVRCASCRHFFSFADEGVRPLLITCGECGRAVELPA